MTSSEKIFDVGIVGYGPAGITASIYAARKKLQVVLIGELPGGEVRNSGEIENWPGSGETDGVALAQQMIDHLKLHEEEVEIIQNKVARIDKNGENVFELDLGGKIVKARTVIYATGRHPRMLGVPGEEKYRNLGLTYCATCDAPLFSGKEVVVIGGGNSGAEAVIMLQKIAAKIYFLHLEDKLRADKILIDNFVSDEKVEIVLKAKTKEILGGQMVTGLKYEDLNTGELKELAVQGVFVTIGAVPNTQPVKNLVELDKFGAVVADRYGITNVEGFFAAGDVSDIRDAQIVVAAGHGCSAALSAGDYLARHG